MKRSVRDESNSTLTLYIQAVIKQSITGACYVPEVIFNVIWYDHAFHQ